MRSQTARCVLLGTAKCVAVGGIIVLARGAFWLLKCVVFDPLRDPLRLLPGPEAGFFQNHFSELLDPDHSTETHRSWSRAYGGTFRFHGFGRYDLRLLTLDPRAISHVLSSPAFEKPWQTRLLLARLLGRGVSVMEGEEHRHQRNAIMPAFTAQSVRALMGLFWEKAEEVKDIWEQRISDAVADGQESGRLEPILARRRETATIDVHRTLSLAIFDVMGLAGFDHAFNGLAAEATSSPLNIPQGDDRTEDEMYAAYRSMFVVVDRGPGLRGLLSLYFPWINWIWVGKMGAQGVRPPADAMLAQPDQGTLVTRASLRTINSAGRRMIESKKAALSAEPNANPKDILGLLIKSNPKSDADGLNGALSDADILDQLSTFLFAGSDTTSTALAWTLHLLAQHPHWQDALRAEILGAPSFQFNSPDCESTAAKDGANASANADALLALPVLDAVVRESLRLAPPVHSTIRVAVQDDVIPLSTPLATRSGSETDDVRIRKGSYVHVAIEGLNTSGALWGDDAATFDPARWLHSDARAEALPAVLGWAGTMAFSTGPHSCPGWRFAMAEMKVFLAVLVRAFVFRPALRQHENEGEEEEVKIRKMNAILTRPYVEGEREDGARLPLRVERYYAPETEAEGDALVEWEEAVLL